MALPHIDVRSEIGPLKRVLLHRPGRELENLMPEYIGRLLFDDIPYLKIAQEEHDAFAQLLRRSGAEVVYLADLAAEAMLWASGADARWWFTTATIRKCLTS